MQRFGWYYFFQIITILLCVFVKGEDDIDFEYVIKTVKVNIYHVLTILFLKLLLLILKSGNSDILQELQWLHCKSFVESIKWIHVLVLKTPIIWINILDGSIRDGWEKINKR